MPPEDATNETPRGVLAETQRRDVLDSAGRTEQDVSQLGALADSMRALADEVRTLRGERSGTQERQAPATAEPAVTERERQLQGEITELREQFQAIQRDVRQRGELGGLTASDPLVRSDDPNKRFSMVRAIQGKWLGWQGVARSFPEREVLEEFGRAKDLPHDTSAAGQLAILIPPVLMPDHIERLSARTVSFNAGAQFLGDLGGSPVEWPKVEGGAVAEWVSESGEPTDSEVTMGALRLTPRELASSAPLTKRLLNMTNDRARMVVEEDLYRAQGEGLDVGILKGGGGTAAPMGIMNVPGVGVTDFAGDIGTAYDDGSGATVQNATDHFDYMLAKIDARNADPSMASWVCHPMTANRIRRVKDEDGHPILVGGRATLPNPNSASIRNTGRGMLWDQPLFTTTLMGAPSANTEFLVGDFSQVLVGGWGPLLLEISDSNGTDFKKRRVLLLMTQLVDCGVRHPEAFEMASNWDLT